MTVVKVTNDLGEGLWMFLPLFNGLFVQSELTEGWSFGPGVFTALDHDTQVVRADVLGSEVIKTTEMQFDHKLPKATLTEFRLLGASDTVLLNWKGINISGTAEDWAEEDFSSAFDGNDVFRGNRYNDLVRSGDGNDRIYGNNGRDSFFGATAATSFLADKAMTSSTVAMAKTGCTGGRALTR